MSGMDMSMPDKFMIHTAKNGRGKPLPYKMQFVRSELPAGTLAIMFPGNLRHFVTEHNHDAYNDHLCP